MKFINRRMLLLLTLSSLMLAACSSVASDPPATPNPESPTAPEPEAPNNPTMPVPSNPAPSNPATTPFQNASSLTPCQNVSGLEALYWDLMVGVIRVDYPETLRLIPYAPGIPFIHPVQPLYNFIYPNGWQAFELTDAATSLTGTNVLRQDSLALWRRLNFSVAGNPNAVEVIDFEVQQMPHNLGLNQSTETVCFLESDDRSAAALLVRSGDFTANISVQVFAAPFGSIVFVQMALAPTVEYELTALNTFFPLSGQMNLGGGSSDPECSDGIDNDGDGATDYPADNGCSSREDDSEAG